MSTANAIMENGTYNLTAIINNDIINAPSNWLVSLNVELQGLLIVSFLAVFGIILFILSRKVEGIKDTKAAVYSGFIISVIALLLFFIVDESGNKLLTFEQLMIFLVITALAILADRVNRNY